MTHIFSCHILRKDRAGTTPAGSYSRRDIDRLAEICALAADGLNLAGIRRVLELQEETRRLQAQLAALREQAAAARRSPPPRPRRTARLSLPPTASLLAGGRRVPAGQAGAQAGGQLALGGQVVFQRHDAQRRRQRMALVKQLPDPGGQHQLPAAVAAPPALGPGRDHRARGIKRAQERLPHTQQFRGLPGGVRREVRVIQAGRHRAPCRSETGRTALEGDSTVSSIPT